MPNPIVSLPVLAGKTDQLDAVVEILEREVPLNYRKGIQIYYGGIDRNYGNETDRSRGKTNDQIVKELQSRIPKSYFLTWHAPYGLMNPQPNFNFIDPRAKAPLRESIAIAQELGARNVILHLTTTFYHPRRQADSHNGDSYPEEYWETYRWKSRWNDYKVVKREIIDVACRHLRDVSSETTRINIAVENMPLTLRGDITTSEEGLMIDPKLHTYQSVLDFLEDTKDCDNVGICLDTSHYLLTKGTLDEVYDGRASLEEGRYIGVNYPEILGRQPPLEDFTEELLATGRLYEVQLAGAGDLWCKDTHVLGEGTSIDSDTVQGRELLRVARLIALSAPNISISFDVNDREDYIGRPNQLRSLRNFFEYMSC